MTRNAATGPARTGLVVTLLLLWMTPGNDLLGVGLIGVSAVGYPVLAFIVALAVYFLVELGGSTWIDANWDRWMAGAGRRFAARLERWRNGRIMGRVVKGITGGSTFWYAVAGAITSPIAVTTIGRVIGGEPIGKDRIFWAAVTNAVSQAAAVVLIGLAVGLGVDAAT
jgi:hypothetical protein